MLYLKVMTMKRTNIIAVFLITLMLPALAYSQEYSIQVNQVQRNYRLKIPKSYDGSAKVPLVLILHGYQNDVKGFGIYTGFDELAEKNGFIAVYPYGTVNDNGYYIWNAGNLYNDWTKGAQDIDFIDSLICYLERSYAIDEKKIFITGHSNGSMMAYRIAAALSDKIAAAACVSGPMVDTIIRPQHPVAIMHIHGDADMVVPHTGTTEFGFQMPSVDQVIKKWLEWDHCSTIPVILNFDSLVTALKWQGDAEVRLYLLHGQGHDWPSVERGDWPASEYIWEFFKQNGKKE
jgi:polyhydroxybutyrate depolymerase